MNNELFSEKEYNVFKKFIHWNIVTDEDQIILDRHVGLDFFQSGYTYLNGEMEATVKLTESGLYHLNK